MKHQFEFIELTVDDFLSRKNILHEIKDGKPAGVIVKNFLSSNECSVMKENFYDKIAGKSQLPLNQGCTYPTVFNHHHRETGGDPQKMATYFESCSNYIKTFKEEFGVDAPQKFQEMFASGSGTGMAKIMPDSDFKNVYPAFSFRDLNPGTGEMTLHCGLFFYGFNPPVYEHILKVVEPGDQLSFFAMIQKPDSGGALTIFDATWDEVDKRVSDLELEAKDGTHLFIGKDLDSFPVDIDTGDLLIFNGGRIWHRVEMVHGEQHRLTLGGFIGFAPEKSAVYYWT
jgi:hypothetical protein